MTTDLKRQAKILPLVDGLMALLSKNLIAHTRLEEDAIAGVKQLTVDNAIRFKAGDQIIIFDDESVWDDDIGQRVGVEFHEIASDPTKTEILLLKTPLGRTFEVSKGARIQKAILNAVLEQKDIYYGDRASVNFNEVAICIEPESKSVDWMALGGVSNYEYRLAIMVYVTLAGSGKAKDEDRAARVCHCYADAIEDLLIRNIHLDLTIDEVPLVADVCPGDSWVYISKDVADEWQPGDGEFCQKYEVQDNFNTCQLLSIIHAGTETTSSSSTSCLSFDISTSSKSLLSSVSTSSETVSSSSSSESSSSFDTSSSSSKSSKSDNISSSTSSLGQSPLSSSSSFGGDAYQVYLDTSIPYHIRVSDKAVLRRKERWMYDSRVDNVEYGNVAKGSFMLKGAKLSWFGKETRLIPFPQIGLGGKIY